ncbi:hypothetical protein AB0I95_21770 [Micromonospora sp. NPDC049751]|uniref:hypothetical protein n=1 Tax=Micromonospora sp. NPDC049751 TaxID=3154837 RepID=UPI0033DA6A67
MNTNPEPATTISAGAPPRVPRTMGHDEMRQHEEQQRASRLSPRDRNHMFVHHDGAWWIGDHDGYVEITSEEQNLRLDRWHERLNNGALWA